MPKKNKRLCGGRGKKKQRKIEEDEGEAVPAEEQGGWVHPAILAACDTHHRMGRIVVLSSEHKNPFCGDGTTGVGVFYINNSANVIELHQGDELGIYAPDCPKISAEKFKEFEHVKDADYILEITGTGMEKFYVDGVGSKCWTPKIQHMFTTDPDNGVYVGASVEFTEHGKIEVVEDITLMPGEKVELFDDYGWDYWHQKLFTEEVRYNERAAEDQVEIRSKLRAVLPNNHLALDGDQQLEYAMYWTSQQ